MSTDAFDKVSSIIGNAMNDAWTKIITDLADVAKGNKPVTNLLVAPAAGALSLDEVKSFFAVAGGANMDISFPSVIAKQPIGLFRASCVDHGIPSKFVAGGPAISGISGSISIGVGISF